MNRNNLIGWIFLVICTIAAPLHAQNSVKVKGAQGRWQVSEEITLKEAEERAFMEAKKEALRKAGVMENVWSVFGQISQESGTEFRACRPRWRAYSRRTCPPAWSSYTAC